MPKLGQVVVAQALLTKMATAFVTMPMLVVSDRTDTVGPEGVEPGRHPHQDYCTN